MDWRTPTRANKNIFYFLILANSADITPIILLNCEIGIALFHGSNLILIKEISKFHDLRAKSEIRSRGNMARFNNSFP